jgi:DNA-binding transcriptional regulator YiaG
MKAQLAETFVGTEGTPGQPYRAMGIEIQKSNGQYRVEIIERWGSNQGPLEEHGRKKVVGRSHHLDMAVEEADNLAREAKMTVSLIAEGISQAYDEAMEWTPDPNQIRELRKEREWNTEALGRECGVSKRTVENWEQGRTKISGPAVKILKDLM